MIRPPRRPLLAAASCLILAACGQSQPERQFTADADAAVTGQFIAGKTLSAPIAAGEELSGFAVLSLPEAAGRGGKLAEKQFLNGWRQSASLDRAKTAGDWNDLTIEIQSAPLGDDHRGQLQIAKPTAEGVRREILARFHGTPMRIVNRPMHNRLGPFGLAVGAGAGGMRCAFAWQWVDNLAVAARGERANFFNSGETPASIRLRLCRRGVTADDLALWYEQLEVDPTNVARIAEALRQNAQTAEGASQVVDASDSLEATLIGGPREAAPHSVGPRRHTARRPGRPAPDPAPDRRAPPARAIRARSRAPARNTRPARRSARAARASDPCASIPACRRRPIAAHPPPAPWFPPARAGCRSIWRRHARGTASRKVA